VGIAFAAHLGGSALSDDLVHRKCAAPPERSGHNTGLIEGDECGKGRPEGRPLPDPVDTGRVTGRCFLPPLPVEGVGARDRLLREDLRVEKG
jgi:hypothetical protein